MVNVKSKFEKREKISLSLSPQQTQPTYPSPPLLFPALSPATGPAHPPFSFSLSLKGGPHLLGPTPTFGYCLSRVLRARSPQSPTASAALFNVHDEPHHLPSISLSPLPLLTVAAFMSTITTGHLYCRLFHSRAPSTTFFDL